MFNNSSSKKADEDTFYVYSKETFETYKNAVS